MINVHKQIRRNKNVPRKKKHILSLTYCFAYLPRFSIYAVRNDCNYAQIKREFNHNYFRKQTNACETPRSLNLDSFYLTYVITTRLEDREKYHRPHCHGWSPKWCQNIRKRYLARARLTSCRGYVLSILVIQINSSSLIIRPRFSSWRNLLFIGLDNIAVFTASAKSIWC